MKRSITILAAILLTVQLWAQSPEKISYQAVVRDADDNLIASTSISMKISILQATSTGTSTPVYVETHTPTTNANGLVSLEIGTGSPAVGSGSFSAIDWANDGYFIKTETDLDGGTDYSITDTTQLLSVPYGLHATTATTAETVLTESDPSVPSGTATGQMQYWDGTAWITVTTGNTGDVLTFINGTPTWVESGSNIDPSTGQIWKDVTNTSTGKTWMDRNLGASQVATSSTDTDAYGDLYQWGRAADGHEDRSSSTIATQASTAVPNLGNTWDGKFIRASFSFVKLDWLSTQNNGLWQGTDDTNNPCPSGSGLDVRNSS
ncbi:MAG: hypothetical protein AAGA62_12500, partial [Bacteroidota bacterium]